MKRFLILIAILALLFALSTIAFADESMQVTGDTITLLRDVTTDLTIDGSKTLNLNAHTLYGTVTVKGTLTLTGGTIFAENAPAVIVTSGCFTLKDGRLLATGDGYMTDCALKVEHFGEAVIENGTIECNAEKSAAAIRSSGKLTVQNGTLIAKADMSYGILADRGSILISGGKTDAQIGILTEKENTLTIQGGTIAGDRYGIRTNDGKIHLCGGTISGKNGAIFNHGTQTIADFVDVCYTLQPNTPTDATSLSQTSVSLTRAVPELNIKSAFLTLDSDISINFTVLDSVLVGWENPYMEFTKAIYDKDGNILRYETERVTEYTLDSGTRAYTFKGVYSVEMPSAVTATLVATYHGVEVRSVTREYSVLKYAQNKLKGNDAPLKHLLVDLLNYGAAAQQFWNYNTKNLANATLSAEQAALATKTDPALDPNIVKTENNLQTNPVYIKSAALLLEEKVSIVYTLSMENYKGKISELSMIIRGKNPSGSTWSHTIKGSDFTRKGDYYVATLDSLTPIQMRSICTTEIRRGQEKLSGNVTYSIEAYAAKKQNDPDAKLVKLLMNMMKYGDAAYAYFVR